MTVSGAAALPDGVTLRSGFTGKEDQAPDFGIGYTDFGARLYSPASRRWMVPDPLSEKYYGISPYAYCAGNPVSYVDPDGRKIYFADGSSEEFKNKFREIIQYMNSRGTAGAISELESSDNIYYISEISNVKYTRFSHVDRTIYWDPNHLVETDLYIWISPATILGHEAEHALYFDRSISGDMTHKEREEYILSRKKNSDPLYGSVHEKIVVEGKEQFIARKHHEINNMQRTRTNHNAHPVPGSVSDKNPFDIEIIVNEHNELF